MDLYGYLADTPQALYWSKIRKNRTKYFPLRGVQDDDITRILLHDVIVERDPIKAEKSFLGLSGLKKYSERLSSNREREWFRRHMRKYINIYLPDCPFEVATTNRYTITTQEAAVIARRGIRKGEPIKYLSGTLVSMTSEEEQDLDLTKRDFSIVRSSRKKTSSLFLGPARFANHDCDANGRLVIRGTDGMDVVAAKNIDLGDEITVSYGEDYFGLNNCECLCQSCERAERNGWTSQEVFGIPRSGTSTPVNEDDISQKGSKHSGVKRKYDSDSVSGYSAGSPSPTKKRKAHRQISRLMREITPPQSDASQREGSILSETSNKLVDPPLTVPKQKRDLDDGIATPESLADSSNGADTKRTGSTHLHGGPTPTDFTVSAERSQPPAITMDIGSFDAEQPPKKRRRLVDLMLAKGAEPEPSPVSVTASSKSSPVFSEDSPRLSSHVSTEIHDPLPTRDQQARISIGTKGTGANPVNEDTIIVAADVTKIQEPDGSLMTIQRVQKKVNRRKQKVVQSIEVDTVTIRVPGDYTKTRKLLAQPYDRWVDCKTCEADFVQSNSYQTRRECPRCERHSMVYGYGWPKTQKEGKNDNEERVMDHRTVHRFLYPHEESQVRKRGKGVASGHGTPERVTPGFGFERGESQMSDLGSMLRRSKRSFRQTM